ncbi:MAG: S46 family peptidase [Flavobacteriales bacterium]|jgi:hypothetical protein|nr:S46 family peptidase [Flavobacteriales bacterium]
MIRIAVLICLALATSARLHAHEGMWLPTLLKSIESDLATAGLMISAEDIYSLEQGSIKDAVVLFGGGCTGEVVSSQGLLFTNHHCGYSTIQRHSSLENDYLTHGFWAADRSAELVNPGLTATFVVRMADVSDRILPGLDPALGEAERRAAVERLAAPIIQEAIAGNHYNAVVRPFNYGNAYYLVVTETFRDVRLVGTPPSAIGKFGGDSDNWMWPRHTGDFAVFRIYAGPDNKPAEPGDGNVPFVPRHVLPISLDGVQEGDFAMIFGFPGNTRRYLTADAVDQVMTEQDPMRISMRRASLEVIDKAMRASDATRIQYASKQSSISNAYKKWIGEVRGLKGLDAVQAKRAQEAELIARARVRGDDGPEQVLQRLAGLERSLAPYTTARDLFIEMVYYGPEVLAFAHAFNELAAGHATMPPAQVDEAVRKLRDRAEDHFKDYDATVDRNVLKALLPLYRRYIDPALAPDALREIDARFKGDADAWADNLFDRSMLVSKERTMALLDNFTARQAKALDADPALRTARSFYASFFEKIRPEHARLGDEVATAMRAHVKNLATHFPERTFWPDANSTLRLSYGMIEGSFPRDGVRYEAISTIDGVVAKHVPGDAEFDLPRRLLDLYERKEYGPYAANGTLPVCFTSSLHTTGGNSGSPVLNGRGELVGINFDRTWESTMSDILFDPEKCRNISVDIRYVLWVIDIYAGAKHLIAELDLVEHGPRGVRLPVHR